MVISFPKRILLGNFLFHYIFVCQLHRSEEGFKYSNYQTLRLYGFYKNDYLLRLLVWRYFDWPLIVLYMANKLFYLYAVLSFRWNTKLPGINRSTQASHGVVTNLLRLKSWTSCLSIVERLCWQELAAPENTHLLCKWKYHCMDDILFDRFRCNQKKFQSIVQMETHWHGMSWQGKFS